MSELSNRIIFPAFTYPYRVFYAETDAGGVVYYAEYLRMFEQARTLYIEEFGLSLTDLADQGCIFAIRRAEVNYRSSAILGDDLRIKTWISKFSTASLVFNYEINLARPDEARGMEPITTGETLLACCQSREGRIVPCRIPKTLKENLLTGPKVKNSW